MLNNWMDSEAGRNLLKIESEKLQSCLPSLLGHYLLQYSAWNKKVVGETSLRHNFFISDNSSGMAQVDFLQLPFRENSIDCVVMHHILEHSENPHQSLREAARVVVPNGYIVIVGFNPWSLWGVSRYIPKSKGPRSGSYLSQGRVIDWLNLLGFRVEQLEKVQFLPPVASLYSPQTSKKIDTFFNWCGLPGSGVYMLVARKLVAGRTPIRPQWRALTGRRIHVATPTTRGMRVSNR